MAIARMQKITLLAEQDQQAKVLEVLQAIKDVEVINLSEHLEEELTQAFDFRSAEAEISEVTSTLQSIHYGINFLKSYVPQSGLFKKLREPRSTYTLDQLEQSVASNDLDQVIDRVQTSDEALSNLKERLSSLREEETFLRNWQKLTFLPHVVDQLRSFKVGIGVIEKERLDQFKALLETADLAAEEAYSNESERGYIVAYLREDAELVDAELQQLNFQWQRYQYDQLPAERLQDNLNLRQEILEEEKRIKSALKRYDDELRYLELAEEYYYDLRERLIASQLVMNNEHMFILTGWTEAELVPQHIQDLNHEIGDSNYALIHEDVVEEEVAEVPTVLKNNALVSAFESYTEQFGMPRYDQTDPTPYYAYVHIFYFGMMSADAGYGLLMWLATFIGMKFFNLKDSTKEALRTFNIMSIGTIIIGLIFGSFFGFSLPIPSLEMNGTVIQLLGLSVVVGIVHMLIGYGLKMRRTLKDGEYDSFYQDGLKWFLMFVGVLLIGANLIFEWGPMVNTVAVWLIVGNIIGMFVVYMITSKNPFVGFGQGLFGIIDVAGKIGDIVSYTRLAAIAISGANIAAAFNLIVGMLPPIARFTIGIFLFLALHALNMFISFLGAYVHAMRLEYVEFFGTFYDGDGRGLKALRPLEKNINIKK